ncbi:large conductance mechanosensitive channel protein MscL [Nodularia spumigena]|uniref:large conductance mechanosensitive channel protein MscL n=1 Tax=Nodularia spumigena TaxID=70799 RepID=UPI002B21F016|nr:large conductance mechanosensitive channel protein MscL [Nodularia spumigena]MEA5615724.1 large conductance mechanosensitive channel protein MscL [Nodularia spumigena UHCC 0040]
MGLIKEFREFALKGNMVDMAVGIIIGGAFGGIVQSLIKDVIMPIVGIAGTADFTNRYFPLNAKAAEAIEALEVSSGAPVSLETARTLGPVMAYGSFITVFINFMILAFVIFIMIKVMNNAKKKFEKEVVEAPKPPPETPEDVMLLRQIRDALTAR